jgi:hypothetical protein
LGNLDAEINCGSRLVALLCASKQMGRVCENKRVEVLCRYYVGLLITHPR